MAYEIDTAATLWQNVSKLMISHYGSVNLSKLADECGFAQSTATRIKQQRHATGIDKLDMISRRFGLSTWQLLVPGLDPKHPPTLLPINEAERKLYERIMAAAKDIVRGSDGEKST